MKIKKDHDEDGDEQYDEENHKSGKIQIKDSKEYKKSNPN